MKEKENVNPKVNPRGKELEKTLDSRGLKLHDPLNPSEAYIISDRNILDVKKHR